jgi:hypothetical protein
VSRAGSTGFGFGRSDLAPRVGEDKRLARYLKPDLLIVDDMVEILAQFGPPFLVKSSSKTVPPDLL